MKMRAMLAAASIAILMMNIAYASAAARISDDTGGRIGDYITKYRALRSSGERVMIDGMCASACTMLLGTIPRDRICVTPRAILAFHGAWDPGPEGHVASSAGNQILWSNYPSDIRKWIRRHGGLQSRIIYLRGPELFAMYQLCR
jgi:hypothetical protein